MYVALMSKETTISFEVLTIGCWIIAMVSDLQQGSSVVIILETAKTRQATLQHSTTRIIIMANDKVVLLRATKCEQVVDEATGTTMDEQAAVMKRILASRLTKIQN